MLLEFDPPNLPTLVLNGGDIVLQELEGTGIPNPIHDTSRIPLRDGEIIGGTYLDVRFIRANIVAVSQSLHAVRREFAQKLNPKKGLGLIRYQPEPSGPIYEIPAKYENGAQYGQMIGPGAERYPLSFRCPNPHWRVSPVQSINLSVEASGWFIPWTIPWTIGQTAGQSTLNNSGDLESYPIIRFTAGVGGAESPRFVNTTTGQEIHFNGLTVPAGQQLIVNMGQAIATLQGENVLQYRTTDSVMWALTPGLNSILVELASGSGETIVEFYRRLLGV